MQPDETNIVNRSGLDEDCAKRNWLGRSLSQAFEMFSSSRNHCYTEDFMYLSDLAVRYYLPPAIDYAASDRSLGDYLFVGGMAVSLAFRLEQHGLSPETVLLARSFAKVVLTDLAKYSLDRNEPESRFWIDAIEYLASEEHRPRNRNYLL